MSQFISLIRSSFPPIYREGEGTLYSFKAFLKTLRSALVVLVALGVLFAATLWISQSAGWYPIVVRSCVVGFLAIIFWKVFSFSRTMSKEHETTKRDWRELKDDPDIQSLVAAAASALVISSTEQQAKNNPLEIDSPNFGAFRQLVVSLAETDHVSQGSFRYTTTVKAHEYAEMAADLIILFQAGDLTLAQVKGGDGNEIPERNRNRIVSALAEKLDISRSHGAIMTSLPRLLNILTAPPDPESAYEAIVSWLHGQQIVLAPLSRDRGFFIFSRRGGDIIVTSRRTA